MLIMADIRQNLPLSELCGLIQQYVSVLSLLLTLSVKLHSDANEMQMKANNMAVLDFICHSYLLNWRQHRCKIFSNILGKKKYVHLPTDMLLLILVLVRKLVLFLVIENVITFITFLTDSSQGHGF